MTLRDEVWNNVLQRLLKTGKFKATDLQFSETQRHTVRRVLREMEDMHWLTRDSDRSSTWRMGENAKIHLDAAPDTIERAEA
jgi:hypothetical protein